MQPRAALALLLAPVLSCTSGSSCTFREPEPEWPPPEPPGEERPADAIEVPPVEVPRAAAPEDVPGDLVEVDADSFPEIVDDLDAKSLLAALDASVAYFVRRRAEDTVASCEIAAVRDVLARFRDAIGRGDPVDREVRRSFRVFRSRSQPLFTGYYEPVLDGRRERIGPFVHPIYRRPPDLVEVPLDELLPGERHARIYGRVVDGRLAPYLSRREIDGHGALAERNLELAWLADPVSRYFLHVQGSGVIRLDDGPAMRVGYAASNGRPYSSIGRLLREEGSLAEGQASAPAIQAFLRDHPERLDEVFFTNERYVFFREVDDGPIGSTGARLTAGRSIAVDPAYPVGLPAYIVTEAPELDEAGAPVGRHPVHRLVLAQDAGAAITGPGRVDLFFGTGDRAGLEAGNMSAAGELYFLLPRC